MVDSVKQVFGLSISWFQELVNWIWWKQVNMVRVQNEQVCAQVREWLHKWMHGWTCRWTSGGVTRIAPARSPVHSLAQSLVTPLATCAFGTCTLRVHHLGKPWFTRSSGQLSYQSLTHTEHANLVILMGRQSAMATPAVASFKCQRCRGRGTCCVGGVGDFSVPKMESNCSNLGSLTHENPSPAPPELVKFAFYFMIYSMYVMLFSERLALVSPKQHCPHSWRTSWGIFLGHVQ